MAETGAVSSKSRGYPHETLSPEVERAAKAIKRAVAPLTFLHERGNDEHVAETARNMLAPRTPFVIGDLSLYTPDALEREIDAARTRLASATGPAADAERQLIDRAEAELARRTAPVAKNVDTYRTSAEVDEAIADETKYLARFRRCIGVDLSAKHERQLEALRLRREMMSFTERACDRAKPTLVDALPHGAAGRAITADDLVAAVKAKVPLDGAQEARVRTAFESWRQRACLETGTDPTYVVDRNKHREAKADTASRAREEVEKYLEIIEAMRGSVLAVAAFLDSAARGESLDAAVNRVRAATVVSDAATTLPAAPAVARTTPKRSEAREVDGLAVKLVDDRIARGHAKDTRFRGVDNTKFEKDPDRITFGPHRPNPSNAKRTLDEARAIYEQKTGRKIPPWVKIVVDDKMPADRDAMYVLGNNADLKERFPHTRLTEGGVTVRIRSTVLASDESIVGHFSHEMWELETLAKMAEERHVKNGQVREHLKVAEPDTRGRENLHGQAWNIADLEVLIMRATPGSPEHEALSKRRAMLLERLESQNHGPTTEER